MHAGVCVRMCGEDDSLIQRMQQCFPGSTLLNFYALVPHEKTMQGKPLQSNSRSTRCGFPALMQVLRWDDKGWYICEHKTEHNHAPSVNRMEKLHWKSHRYIDRYTRYLVMQLRENNISSYASNSTLARKRTGKDHIAWSLRPVNKP